MKYSVSNRQHSAILLQADEIIVQERDYREIPDLFVKYPNQRIILYCQSEFIDNNKELLINYKKASDNFVCAINNIRDYYLWFIENEIKFFYQFPVDNLYDFNGLIDLGVEYIKIASPLTFSMNTFKDCPIKIRMCPNISYSAYIPRENGIYGQWVRPEDVKYYENVYIFDFEDADLQKERALFNIYKAGIWQGNLNIIISNLNVNVDNRGILEDIGKKRSNCNQRCQLNHKCDYCKIAFDFSKAINTYKKQDK